MAKIDSKSLNKMIENGRNIGSLCTDCIKKISSRLCTICRGISAQRSHKVAIKNRDRILALIPEWHEMTSVDWLDCVTNLFFPGMMIIMG